MPKAKTKKQVKSAKTKTKKPVKPEKPEKMTVAKTRAMVGEVSKTRPLLGRSTRKIPQVVSTVDTALKKIQARPGDPGYRGAYGHGNRLKMVFPKGFGKDKGKGKGKKAVVVPERVSEPIRRRKKKKR